MLTMRTSERRSLKGCAQQWYWSQVEGLVPKRAANPLWFGTAIHEALAQWYRLGTERGPLPQDTFLKVLAGDKSMIVTNDDDEAEYVDARTMGHDMLKRYVEKYGRDENWEVLAVEQTLKIVLSRPEMKIFGRLRPAAKRWIRYVMTFDGVYRDRTTKEIWLMEHKSAAGIRVDHLPLDDQAGSYWAFAEKLLRKRGIIGPDDHIAGIMYNFLRKAKSDPRVQNEDGLYTNKPVKSHYVKAIGDANWGGELTGKETLADLEAIVETMNEDNRIAGWPPVVVIGEPSASQPPPYLERFPVYRSQGERTKMIQRIKEEAVFAEAYREGWLPVTKSPDRDRCSFCQFKLICQLDEAGETQSVEEMKELTFNRRDPYEVYAGKSA
jgi:hypothetical protein